MFIELHQTKDGLPISVNTSSIQCFASGGDMCSCVYFDSEVRIEVQESYDDIVQLLYYGRETVVRNEDLPSILDLLSRLGADREEDEDC